MQAATRQEQKAATRDRLVNAAMALFARKGIVQTTTADIAKSIRMSHGVVFLHFPKRDDLVIAVIDEFGRRLGVEFRQALEQDLGLRAVLRAHLRVLAEFEPFYARLVTEAPLLPPKVRSTRPCPSGSSWRWSGSARRAAPAGSSGRCSSTRGSASCTTTWSIETCSPPGIR